MTDSALETRNAAYCGHRASGALGAQQQRVMRLFAVYPGSAWSLNEIAEATGIRLSSVSGRVAELKAGGHLFEAPKRKDRITGITITPVAAVPEQLEFF